MYSMSYSTYKYNVYATWATIGEKIEHLSLQYNIKLIFKFILN